MIITDKEKCKRATEKSHCEIVSIEIVSNIQLFRRMGFTRCSRSARQQNLQIIFSLTATNYNRRYLLHKTLERRSELITIYDFLCLRNEGEKYPLNPWDQL